MTADYQSDAKSTARTQRASARETTQRANAPTTGERLYRKRTNSDPLAFDRRIQPQGMSYEWKREATKGEPATAHQIDLRENHWRAVPAARHPELAIEGDAVIRRGDTILMERPAYLTDEARMEDIGNARRPIEQQEEMLYGTPAGQMTRNHPSVRNVAGVHRHYAPGDPISPDGNFAEP